MTPHCTLYCSVPAQDTARFKLSPDMGWGEVVGEVAKRLKVDASQVKLKYLDDEQEWMLLSTDQVSRHQLVAPYNARTFKLRKEEEGRRSCSKWMLVWSIWTMSKKWMLLSTDQVRHMEFWFPTEKEKVSCN
jgi:hypothetical protein